MRLYIPTIIVVFLDQLSKLWIKNNLDVWTSIEILGSYIKFTHVKNTGLAFGISIGGFKFLIAILSIMATIFIVYLHWIERKNHFLIRTSYGLILGGAIGNLIDRSYIFFVESYTGVVDFIDIGFNSYRWYVFNVADSAVTIGVIIYILHSLMVSKIKI